MVQRNARTSRSSTRPSSSQVRAAQRKRSTNSEGSEGAPQQASPYAATRYSRYNAAHASSYVPASSAVHSSSASHSASSRVQAVGSPQAALSANAYRRTDGHYAKQRKKSLGKKIAIATCIVLLVALVGCGTAFALFVNSVNDTLDGNLTEEEAMAINDALVSTTYEEPFYVLLIGSDSREDDESMGARSDTNILVRVDPTQGIVTLISIPRDTMIEIDGYGTCKFNAAYAYNGVAGTIKAASELCDVEISHYAEVDFEGLVQLVDVVGGVEVDVPQTIDDSKAADFVIEAGLQTLNGEQALAFARSRAYVDGDFTRTSNQRLLIEALVNKVLSLPLAQLPSVIQSAAQCVTTDMTVQDMFNLVTQFEDLNNLTMYSAMVPSTTGDVGGVSYVFADEDALEEMMEIVEEGGDPNTVETTASIGSYLSEDDGDEEASIGTSG